MERLAKNIVALGHEVRMVARFVKERPLDWRKVYTSSEQACSYDDDGVSVSVVTHPSWMTSLMPLLYKLQFYRLASPIVRRIGVWAYQSQLAGLLEECDVIHYSGNGQEMLGFAVARLAQQANTPLIVTPHTHANAWGDGPQDFDLYRLASQIIALTKDEQERLVSAGLAKDRVSIVAHGVELSEQASGERFRNKHGISGPMVFFLGRKTQAKGYNLLLDAARHVWKNVPRAIFVLAGPSDSERKEASEVVSDKRIIELGFLSNEERDDAYAAADVFCLPSLHEAFGLAYFEAWAHGTPVVGLQIPTLVEIIEEAEGGILSEPSPTAVAGALSTVLSDADLREKLGEAGRKRVDKRSWRTVAEETCLVYRRAMVV